MTGLMIAAALAAAIATPPAPAPSIDTSPRLERWAHIAIAGHIVAQFADVGTTLYSLGRFGCDSSGRSLTKQTICFKEANPLLRWSTRDPALHAVVKGVAAAATSYALLKMHKKRPKAAIATAAVSAALTAYVAHRNAQQIRRHQK